VTLSEVASDVYAWVQPDGSWFINNAGDAFDLMTAFTDAVALNGGPLDCAVNH
jgi:hypothetical protein